MFLFKIIYIIERPMTPEHASEAGIRYGWLSGYYINLLERTYGLTEAVFLDNYMVR